MGVRIDFECPECHRIFPRDLTDLRLGKATLCPDCGARHILTETALRDLESRLEEYCRP